MHLTIITLVCSAFILFPSSEAAETVKIGQPLFCHGCVAVIKELHKVLKDSMGRKKPVNQSLKSLCNLNNFVSYTFSPPKMIKACNYIVDTYRDELEENLTDYYKKFKTQENLPLQEKFCDQVIKACEGVRRPTKESEMKPHGFSMDDANKELHKAAQNGFTSVEHPVEDHLQVEKPDDKHTTPMPREEL